MVLAVRMVRHSGPGGLYSAGILAFGIPGRLLWIPPAPGRDGGQKDIILPKARFLSYTTF